MIVNNSNMTMIVKVIESGKLERIMKIQPGKFMVTRNGQHIEFIKVQDPSITGAYFPEATCAKMKHNPRQMSFDSAWGFKPGRTTI